VTGLWGLCCVAYVLLGHKTVDNNARYLGIEEEQAMKVAEQFEI